jgi:hypothetical protein
MCMGRPHVHDTGPNMEIACRSSSCCRDGRSSLPPPARAAPRASWPSWLPRLCLPLCRAPKAGVRVIPQLLDLDGRRHLALRCRLPPPGPAPAPVTASRPRRSVASGLVPVWSSTPNSMWRTSRVTESDRNCCAQHTYEVGHCFSCLLPHRFGLWKHTWAESPKLTCKKPSPINTESGTKTIFFFIFPIIYHCGTVAMKDFLYFFIAPISCLIFYYCLFRQMYFCYCSAIKTNYKLSRVTYLFKSVRLLLYPSQKNFDVLISFVL